LLTAGAMAKSLNFPAVSTDGAAHSVVAFSPADRFLDDEGRPLRGLVLRSGDCLLRWLRYGEYEVSDTREHLYALSDVGV